MSRTTDIHEMPKAETAPPKKLGRPAKAFNYAEGRQSINRSVQFWAFVEGYPDQTGIAVHLYRLVPEIDLGLIGITDHSYIEALREPHMWNTQYIEEAHGRGKYMVKLFDQNNKPVERAKSWVDLSESEVPAKLDIRTLKLHSEKNVDYVAACIASGVLERDEDGRPKIPGPAKAAAAGSAAPAPAPAAPAVNPSGFSPRVLDMVAERMIDRAFHDAPAVPASAPTQQAESVVNMAVTLAGMMRPAKAEKQTDTLDVLEAYERVKRIVEPAAAPVAAVAQGGAEVPTANFWTALPDILRALPQVIAGVAPYFQQRAAAAAQGSGIAVPAVTAAPAAADPPPPPPAPVSIPGIPSELMAMFSPAMIGKLRQVVPFVTAKFLEGRPAMDVASAVCLVFGNEVYKVIYPLGADTIMHTLAALPDPAIQSALSTRSAELREWLDDFLAYDVDGTGGEEAEA